MGCLFVILGAFFPRIALFILWLTRPAFFNAAFGGNWLWPVLGFLLLPFATLMYLLLVTPGAGLSNLDWLWLGLAFLLDIGGFGSSRNVYLDRWGRRT